LFVTCFCVIHLFVDSIPLLICSLIVLPDYVVCLPFHFVRLLFLRCSVCSVDRYVVDCCCVLLPLLLLFSWHCCVVPRYYVYVSPFVDFVVTVWVILPGFVDWSGFDSFVAVVSFVVRFVVR